MSRRHRLPLGRIFAIPAVIAVVTLAGLVVALVGDAWRDMLSWVALGVPVAIALHFGLRRGRRGA